MKLLLQIFLPIIFLFGIAVWFLGGPPQMKSEQEIFTVPQVTRDMDIPGVLQEKGFIRNVMVFDVLLPLISHGEEVKPGGFYLTKSMWAWQVAAKIIGKPDLMWVTVNGCQRREEIGNFLARALGWDQRKLDEWNGAYKSMQPEYGEGVYYPDTYLIPVEESGTEVAKRFINRFNEKFAPYVTKFQDANIRWPTALKIASLIEREAGSASDMPVIAAVIWNRLDKNMALQIDATMQYTRGQKSDGSWWGSIDLSEKQNESPYNTYLHKGLPPTPICSPSLASIDAVLHPAETDCLFYLHDATRVIHCAATYQEHLKNIKAYLQ